MNNKDRYRFEAYSDAHRWASYYYQLSLVLDRLPETVLEVGVGHGVLGHYLRVNTAVRYTGLDLDPRFTPDVVGSAISLPFSDSSFDVAVAYEVLEHLPFECLSVSLGELRRVSKRHVILSLPHFGPRLGVWLKIPVLPEIRVAFKIPYLKKHVFDGEHHWEIAKRGYPVERIRAVIEHHFTIVRDFIPFENQAHHFFVLEKR